MMMIDYKALAERVAQRAIYADNNADQNNKTWAADLRTVVSLLNGMAGQKPFAWAIRDGWSQTRFSVDPDTPILGTRRADYVVDALYLHPAPAAPHGDASRMIDALQSIRAHVEHDPSALAAAIVATCDSVLDAAPQAEPMADSDADYWLRNRQAILDAIERAGFVLMSNASGFWLHPRGATDAQAEPKREPTCLWSRADDDTDVWETSCGHAFTIIEGTPSDNHMEFCCYCGRRVDEEIGGSDE